MPKKASEMLYLQMRQLLSDVNSKLVYRKEWYDFVILTNSFWWIISIYVKVSLTFISSAEANPLSGKVISNFT